MATQISDQLPKTNSRTLKGLWVRPRMQLFLCLLLSLGFLIQGGLLLVILQNFNRYFSELRAAGSIDVTALGLFSSEILPLIRIAIMTSGFFAIAGLAVGIILGHRIFGPMVPIRAHVKRLIDGNYSERVKVRTGDEFHDLVLDLNVLAEILENKKR